MSLALPKLDNRTYDELVREGQRSLPRQAPVWTDHNAHDPGITLLELFAWLVEQDIYRLDRTPDANVRAFLRLAGIEPRPPQVATTVVELTPNGTVGTLDLPAGVLMTDAGGAVAFETQAPVHLTSARLVAVESVAGDVRTDRSRENTADGSSFLPFGATPSAGDALLLGFDAPLGGGGETITLHLWSDDPEADAGTRARLVEEWQRSQREVDAACPPGERPNLPDWKLHYSARTVWEYHTAAGTWAVLDSVEDETRGLSLTGFVRFRAPVNHVASGISAHLWTVRCRLVSGRYECPPVVARIAVNAVAARHAVSTRARTIGVSQGHASESFVLERAPAVAESVHLQVLQDGIADGAWHEVGQWDRVGPHDRAFRLEPERARISFGDGHVGRVPPAGATLVCAYRVGGGAGGNIAAGTLVDVSAPVTLRLPFAAFGGAAAETLDVARGRALAFFVHPVRAITLSDFETLALSTPGVPVARARALAGYHPDVPCLSAAGVVTVVAIPSCPAERPEPGPDFLNAVYRWLTPRCALTTELHVVGPSYRVVGVHARLHAEPGVEPNALAATAAAALDRFFHPLEGGPEGTGWPVGRAIYRSEVLALLNSVEGVAFVDRLSLVPENETDASCANVPLCPAELAAAGEHRLPVIARRQVR
jgi:hypothetical protein